MKDDDVVEDKDSLKPVFFFKSLDSHSEAEKRALIRQILLLMLATKVTKAAKIKK